MTVAENMGFSLRLGGAPKAEIKQKVDRAAAILGLQDLLERQPRQLSGGQRQRVAMGRAIVRDPQVFLFDEPLSNLDAKLRVQMRAEIKELHQRLGTTTIYVTHDQIEAMTMADKIVVLRDEVVEQMGTPLELYDCPANMFVAGFIGSPSMNFINGSIMARFPDRGRLYSAAWRRGVCRNWARSLWHQAGHLRLDPGGIEVKLVVVEPTGSETMVVARLGQQQIVGVSATHSPAVRRDYPIAPTWLRFICSARMAAASCQVPPRQREIVPPDARMRCVQGTYICLLISAPLCIETAVSCLVRSLIKGYFQQHQLNQYTQHAS